MSEEGDEITYAQAYCMYEHLCYQLEVHLAHCLLCIAGKWYCPDANQLQESRNRWQERMAALKTTTTQK